MTDAVSSVHLYRLASGLHGAPIVPAGWEVASDPCGRYGSVWCRREVKP